MFVPLRDVNPTRTVSFVNYLLILVNVGVFVSMLGPPEAYVAQVTEYGLVPKLLLTAPASEVPSLLSHMFLHGGLGHLASNMLFLYIFGDNIEDALGHFRYLVFYLISGLCAAVAHILIEPLSTVPMVGASGAIAGVVGGYLVLYPRAPIVVFNSFLPLWFFIGIFPVVPAWLIAGEFFVVNLLQGLGSLMVEGGIGIAFFAHIGGFLAGLVLVKLFAQARPGRTWSGFREADRRRRRPYD